jgi:hypothetical protein
MTVLDLMFKLGIIASAGSRQLRPTWTKRVTMQRFCFRVQ